MFEGFEVFRVEVGGSRLRVRSGGTGDPVLLLHGHPQTHVMWHLVAPALARTHTLILPDLPGYGESALPPPPADGLPPASKRGMAAQLVQLIAQLGHRRFSVVGHNRGGRFAYRMALDHEGVVGG
ncbi:MAG: alpha/beta fold hydrolase [Candidatus Dormiibacterota bacterium]